MASTGEPRRPTLRRSSASVRRRDERGFSLNETLVALGVTALAFMAALSLLAFDNKIYSRSDAQQETVREGRYALNLLERDLQMAGFSVDIETPDAAGITGQPMIVSAGPYDIVFNGDIDEGIRAILSGATGAATPTGYAPPSYIGPAETIRYTLDSTVDGAVTPADCTDQMDEKVVANNGLCVLQREVYGYNGTNNVNPAGAVALVRGPAAYPSGTLPEPLFQYWGYFTSPNRLDLWGDDGTPGGIAKNGRLEPEELTDLTPVMGEDANSDGIFSPGEDRNGNGVWEPRVSELIRKVDVTITSETIRPDLDYVDSLRSGENKPFRFHTFVLRSQVQPRNIEILGASNCGNPPAAPTKVKWQKQSSCNNALTDGEITLSWDLSADDGKGENDVSEYGILRSNTSAAFGPDPVAEVPRGETTVDDDSAILQGWPPVQNWYSVEARDCRPATGASATVGPYPASVGPAYPMDYLSVQERPGDDGRNVDITFAKSWDEGGNHSGYGGVATGYWVYRSMTPEYRCVAPIHESAIGATGAARYTWTDNSTNSTPSGPDFGKLYYYWMRATNGSNLSPYSPTYCTRTYKGPALPLSPRARVIDWVLPAASATREVWFSPNPANDGALYDPYAITYKVYRSATNMSKVGKSAGYTEDDYRNSVKWTGLVWAVDSGATGMYHSVAGGADPASSWHSSASFSTSPTAVSFGSRLHGIVARAGGKISHTLDGGVIWRQETVGSTDFRDVAHVNSLIAVVVGPSNTLLRTINGGFTWVAVDSSITGDLAAVAAGSSPRTAQTPISRVLVVNNNGSGVALSTSAGASFTSKTGLGLSGHTVTGACLGIDSSSNPWYVVGTSKPSYKDKGITYPAESGIYSTTDAGFASGWSNVTPLGATCDAGWTVACAWDQRNSEKVVFAACKDSSSSTAYRIWWDSIGIHNSSESSAYSGAATDIAVISKELAWISTSSRVYRRYYNSGTASWTWAYASVPAVAIAARPEIVWEDPGTVGLAPYARRYYVVTSSYAAGPLSLNGESGIAVESAKSVILVDACNNFEVVAP